MLRYTLMRLGIFAASFLVIWGLVVARVVPRGLGGSNYLWVALLALVISAPISYVVLRKERDRASEHIVARVDRAKANFDRNASQEDAADDADRARRAQDSQGTQAAQAGQSAQATQGAQQQAG
ncbi:DUF4229 domain-containing protein [Streptomyces sp. TS71-3]|uniref:DUF4229 domain-containing protein n=1 Tax=Streptomyces sp. TS71-3 TaxID=2733862 RepID=UPI001B299C68|nr:DUF4229 domain-containing protein [Streptomyces sp. TS71-3]GHJ34823.1 membrane protein [Streptomyces sp. TS71-3]